MSNEAYKEISLEDRNLLVEIAKHWQDTLLRQINEHFERCKRKFKPIEFEPIGIAERCPMTALNKVKIYHWPNLHLEKCYVDFKNAHLNLEMSVGQILMDGEVYMTSQSGDESYQGLFKFDIVKEAPFKIFVGLRKECDSFVSTTYYYELNFEASEIKVISDSKNPVETAPLQCFIGNYIKMYLHNIIKNTVDRTIVEFSYSELFDGVEDGITNYLTKRTSNRLGEILESVQSESAKIGKIPFEFQLRHGKDLAVVKALGINLDMKLLHCGEYESLRFEDQKAIYCSDGDICNIECKFSVVLINPNKQKMATFLVRPLRTKIFIGCKLGSSDTRNLGNTHVTEITDLDVEEDWNAEPVQWVKDELMPYMKTYLRTYATSVCIEFNKYFERKYKINVL